MLSHICVSSTCGNIIKWKFLFYLSVSIFGSVMDDQRNNYSMHHGLNTYLINSYELRYNIIVLKSQLYVFPINENVWFEKGKIFLCHRWDLALVLWFDQHISWWWQIYTSNLELYTYLQLVEVSSPSMAGWHFYISTTSSPSHTS